MEEAKLKVFREKKAVIVVEELLSDTVTIKYLQSVANYIERRHYQDVVSERSLILLCGYVLCRNKLNAISQQKFKIDRRLNKVYDISERKYFCSDKCFEASISLENQISTVPLWLRDDYNSGNCQNLLILNVSEVKGVAGKEVEWDVVNIQKEVADLEFKHESSEITDNRTKTKNYESIASGTEKTPVNVELPDFATVRAKILSWKSVEMLKFLQGQQQIEERYMNQMQGVHSITNASSILNPELMSEYAAKVKKFILWQGKECKATADSSHNLNSEVATPAVSSRREQILLEKLNVYMQKLLGNSFARNIRATLEIFVYKLNLSNLNIIFKPREWPVVCVVIMHLLVAHDKIQLELTDKLENLDQIAMDSLLEADESSIQKLVSELVTLPPLLPMHILKQ